MRRLWLLSTFVLVTSCVPPRAETPAEPKATGFAAARAPALTHPTFEDEVAFLTRTNAATVVLVSDSGGRVVVSPALQGRVMTSAVAENGASLGWINHPFLESGKRGTQFDNYGGEDRFWLGPEGGQFGLYFAPDAPFAFAKWQTPPALNEGAWSAGATTSTSLVLTHSLHVTNHSGATFDVAVERTVTILSRDQLAAALGLAVPASVQAVAFETKNRITNAGRTPWTRDRGLLSVWILGMYAPSPDAHVVMPFDPTDASAGDIVNDRYFGKVPKERLAVHPREGYLAFTCDGALRSKIGLKPGRARSPLASYSASARLLTFVQYDKPAGATDYVDSMWEQQTDPYAGDVVNSYNDGPTEPVKPSLGGFYEIESSSPAAALAPDASLVHTHRTFHLVGDRAELEAIARRVLGIGLDDFSR